MGAIAERLINSALLGLFRWLSLNTRTKESWTLNKFEYYIASKYGVAFESKQSYYDLFKEARISWKKTQAHNPKYEAEHVA